MGEWVGGGKVRNFPWNIPKTLGHHEVYSPPKSSAASSENQSVCSHEATGGANGMAWRTQIWRVNVIPTRLQDIAKTLLVVPKRQMCKIGGECPPFKISFLKESLDCWFTLFGAFSFA